MLPDCAHEYHRLDSSAVARPYAYNKMLDRSPYQHGQG